MRLNEPGGVVRGEWKRLPEGFPNLVLNAFLGVPNHIHGIVLITDANL